MTDRDDARDDGFFLRERGRVAEGEVAGQQKGLLDRQVPEQEVVLTLRFTCQRYLETLRTDRLCGCMRWKRAQRRQGCQSTRPAARSS